jgi:sulfite exporter TauE/SafE
MVYFLFGLLAALAATPHCVGMCGGFALHLSRAPRTREILARQALFFAAKTTVYVFLGALVGALGLAVVGLHRTPQLGSYLAYAAGGITILLGLGMLIPWRGRVPAVSGFPLLPAGGGSGCAATAGGGPVGLASLGSRLMASSGAAGTLTLGLFAGFLPCPLTTTLLVVAAGYHSVLAGILLLLGAGVGTLPGLLGASWLGGAAANRFPRLGLRALGVVVILLGLALILRHAQAAGLGMSACCTGGM